MTNARILSFPPAARSTDPGTSHQAADEITASGRRQTLAEQCLEVVRTQPPGLTAGEIGEVSGLGHDRVWRRLSDLKNQGKIEAGEPRRWHGKAQVTWYPVWQQMELPL